MLNREDITPVAAILELQRMNLVYGQRNVEEAHTQDWLRVRDQGYDAILNNRLDPVTLSDRISQAGIILPLATIIREKASLHSFGWSWEGELLPTLNY